MKFLKKISILFLLVFSVLFSTAQDCWFKSLMDDIADPNVSSEFKILFDNAVDAHFDAYRICSNHPNIRTHVPSIEKVVDLLNDGDFMGKLPRGKTDLEDIIDAVKNPLVSGSNSKLVQLTEHLENVKQVVKKHFNADGFNRLMTDLKNPAFAMQDGTSHMLNDVKNIPEGMVKKFDYEFDGDGVVCTRCRYDVELNANSGELKLIEYKSWSLENISNISIQQMKEYFGSIDYIIEMKYVFNKLKTPDLDAVKTQMQLILLENAPDIFQRMQPTLKTDLAADNLPDFLDLVNDPNSKLYNFIEIK